MVGWENINFNDSPSAGGHPMYPLVVQIMECIYRTANFTHIPSFRPRMDYWYSPSLGYKVDQSGSRLEIVILNLREGVQRKNHFMINLITMNVHDKFKNIHFAVPEEVGSAARQLREHVRNLVRERKEMEEARRRKEELRRQKAREELRKRVQTFYHCLIEIGLLDEDDPKRSPDNNQYCPLCSVQLTSCTKCRVISCSNGDCKASSAVPIVKCHAHPSMNFCTSCLESSSAGCPPHLGRCPICTHWFCSSELSWCLGRPFPNESTGSIESLSTIAGDSGMVTRLHPPRPISCHSPACKMTSNAGERTGRRCSNSGCWSMPDHIRLVCPECTTQDSFTCPCSRYWTCGSCKFQPSSADGLATCPRCHRSFCPSCSYIGDCTLCGRGGLCNDCMEEENSLDVQVVNVLNKCGNCEGHLCDACSDHNEWFCEQCDRRMCRVCGEESDVCERCTDRGGAYESNADDFGFFSFGSGNEMTWHGV